MPRSRISEFTHRLGLVAGVLITLVGHPLFPSNLGLGFLVYGAARAVGWVVDGLVQSGPAAASAMGRWTRWSIVGLTALYVVGSPLDEWWKNARQAEKQAERQTAVISHCGERPVSPPQRIRRPDEAQRTELEQLQDIRLLGKDSDRERRWRDCEEDVLRALAR